MCGIIGNIAVHGARAGWCARRVRVARDLLAHRGPDGAGLWAPVDDPGVVLAHRRLAVIDPTPTGAQPMALSVTGALTHYPDDPALPISASAAGQALVLVYNGELYNDHEVRRELAAHGVYCVTRSDSETVLRALALWGRAALSRFRGMYALAAYDPRSRRLLLARDPLGVKPLYYWHNAREVVFASEPPALLAHPSIPMRPDMLMVSAYLTTIRTVLGDRTLFEGVRSVQTGEAIVFDCAGPCVTSVSERSWHGPRVRAEGRLDDSARVLHAALEDSVRRHLRADVPTCALLSGGIDSTVIASIAARTNQCRGAGRPLRTYCAGAALPASCREVGAPTDVTMARRVSSYLGTDHSEALLDRECFAGLWTDMIGRMGVPLSTPNETAIYLVSSRLRADGCVVTLSGEGADELLGGYDAPLSAAVRYIEARRATAGGSTSAGGSGGSTSRSNDSPGRFALESACWISPRVKHAVVSEGVWRDVNEDEPLVRWYENAFREAAQEAGDDGLCAHLRLSRMVNLTGLLQRLDSATMLAGVEGRVPFADAVVAGCCEAMPAEHRFALEEVVVPDANEDEGTARVGRAWEGGAAVGQARTTTVAHTKIALREAFARELPPEVLYRPKASFPLPIQEWAETGAQALRRGAFAGSLFTSAAVNAVAGDPRRNWNLAWPMINIAMWGERWWGSRSAI